MKYVTIMILGIILMLSTSLYMYDGIVNDYTNKQPLITPLGIFVGLFLTFYGMVCWGYKQEVEV